MKEKFKTLINNKNLIIILIITLIISIGTAGTYAWFTWSNPSNTNLTLTIGNIDVMFDTGNNINITNLSPVLYPEEGAKATFSLKKNNASLGDINYTITLDITTISNELKSTDFKWLLKQGNTELSNGDFSTSSNNSSITLYTGTLTDTSTVSYDLYFYINGNSENNSNMMNKTLTGTINISGEEKETLATHITSLYTNAEKSEVTNNSITYNYATSVSLMNDRLGSSTTDINGGNIRYYGGTPDNYIYFNCSDYSNQTDTTCEKWRIIGVFNGKVKIIRNESIGSYSWDNKDTSTGAETAYGKNDWTTARLMKLLNPSNYYTTDTNDNGYGQGLYYNGQSGTCFSGQNNATTSCNFTSTGLKNDTTRNMISEETWHLKAEYSEFTFANGFYNSEISSSQSWNGKVGLLYLSELVYSQSFVDCNIPPEIYSNFSDTCSASNNWLIKNNNYNYIWLITSSGNSYVFIAGGDDVLSYTGGMYTYEVREILPVLYLNSNIELASNTGNGTSTNPYKLSV